MVCWRWTFSGSFYRNREERGMSWGVYRMGCIKIDHSSWIYSVRNEINVDVMPFFIKSRQSLARMLRLSNTLFWVLMRIPKARFVVISIGFLCSWRWHHVFLPGGRLTRRWFDSRIFESLVTHFRHHPIFGSVDTSPESCGTSCKCVSNWVQQWIENHKSTHTKEQSNTSLPSFLKDTKKSSSTSVQVNRYAAMETSNIMSMHGSAVISSFRSC